MKDKQFNKKLPKYCKYCVFGNVIADSDEVLCIKRGITLKDDTCRKYKYNPLNREPQRQKIYNGYNAESFSIE